MPKVKKALEPETEAVVPVALPKTGKHYVRDVHDRRFNKKDHGVDLHLEAGKKAEVHEKVALHLKKHFPYLEVTHE